MPVERFGSAWPKDNYVDIAMAGWICTSGTAVESLRKIRGRFGLPRCRITWRDLAPSRRLPLTRCRSRTKFRPQDWTFYWQARKAVIGDWRMGVFRNGAGTASSAISDNIPGPQRLTSPGHAKISTGTW